MGLKVNIFLNINFYQLIIKSKTFIFTVFELN